MAITSTCHSGSLLPLTRTPALTTIWTPPAFCSTRFHAGHNVEPPYNYGWQDEVDPLWYSCMPPEWDSTACQSLTFSPALDCPHGWTIDASKSVMGPGGVSRTFATCCMSGFTAALNWDGEKCAVPVVNYPIVVLATDPSDGEFQSPIATDVRTTTIEKGAIDHRAIVIGWELSDLSTSSPVPISSLPTSRHGPGPSPSPTSTAAISPSPETETKTLSSGSIAGIAVGGLAVVALVLSAIYLLWKHRRRAVAGGQPAAELETSLRPELSSPPGEPKPLPYPSGRHELGPGGPGNEAYVHEMPGQ